MTNDTPADVATGSDPKEPTPTTKTAARTTRATAEKATKSARNKTKTSTKAGTNATQEDPGEESSSSDNSSSSSADDRGMDQSSSDHEEDPTFHHSFKTGADPFSPEWYQSKTRTYIEETLQVPGSHRHNYPRPCIIRNADFNRTLSSCSTGARQEAEVLYTATAFLGLQINRSNEFLESHPKIDKAAREHLEENWTYTFGIHEYLLARLDIIEGLQGDSQSQALAEIQQARVRSLLGRGSISTETYQIYLPADTRAKMSAATSRKPRQASNRCQRQVEETQVEELQH
jgi:uncharacterized protein involved in copper resistance